MRCDYCKKVIRNMPPIEYGDKVYCSVRCINKDKEGVKNGRR